MSTASLREWLAGAPAGTMVPASAVLERLNESDPVAPRAKVPDPVRAVSWRERLWTCPDETRLGLQELSEAIGKNKHWIYRHTSAKSRYRIIPHKKIDGALIFRADQIRIWIGQAEQDDQNELSRDGVAAVPRVLSITESPTRRRT